MFEPNVPLVEGDPSPLPPQPGMAGSVSPRNCIDDPETDKWVRDNLPTMMQWTRDQRRDQEYEWMELRRCDMLVHDSNQKYKGRSNAYLPVVRKNLDTLVAALLTGLFPTDDNMDVVDKAELPTGKAKKVKALLQWEFEENAKVQQNLETFIRQYCMLGTAIGKYRYKQVKPGTGYGTKMKVDDYGNIGTATQALSVDGCEFTTRNIFDWHIYPLTAANLDEAMLIFEDLDVPLTYIENKIKTANWPENTKDIAPVPEHDYNQQDLKANYQQQLNANATNSGGGEISQMRTLTECWLYMKLPASEYFEGEDKSQPVPCRVIMARSTPVEICRNPFWDQKPPYVDARMNVQAGNFYGEGFAKAAKAAQLLANDFVNQTNDNGIYALNPIVLMNPSLMTGPMRPLAPGVVIPVSDPAAVTFSRPPSDQISTGLQLTQMWMGYGQDLGGAPPVLQGSKAASTATSSQILQQNAAVPLQNLVRSIERTVLIPLMKAFWYLNQQYRTDEVFASVAGEVIRVAPSDLAIDAQFGWLASSMTRNAQQRAQQATAYLQQLVNPGVLQLLMQQGLVVNPAPLLERIFTDGLGFRGFDQIIRPAPPPPPMQPGGPPQPGQPPGPPQAGPPGQPPPGPPPGDRARSTLEQIGAPQGQMAPGEGEAFGEVRNNADQMAASMGGASMM